MLVGDMLEKLRWPGKIRYTAWSTLRRKSVYGWSEAAVRKNLVKITFLGKEVWVHRKVADSLKSVNAKVRAYERDHDLKHYNPNSVQCFNWRNIRGGTTLSRHAHAIALDIDPPTNPYNGHTTSLPTYVVQLMVDAGWEWGGRWRSPVDPMHFQRH